ncbi:YkoF family thiamine/hydroxymethylpyrimidine-binding protein [Clostridiaceae bacterium M8S5]|nr:YkoF family thiamine/hydroxymethylpyrimidine-binding protein [Clostridiaceae bacterium M8S5]
MCSMEKVATCQISFIPIISNDYIDDINKVLDIIKSYDVKYTIGLMSTTVHGNKDVVLSLINQLFNDMYDVCSFSMDIKLSNLCGCSDS